MNSSSDEEFPHTDPPPARITTEIEQLIGKANQHFIFQEFDAAIDILHDVITKAPGIPDPYHVLALIYEERKEHEKAVNFFMLAAQVTQHDSDLWAKVAHMHKELGHYKEAIYCYSRALLNKKQPEIEIMKKK
jgi:general transcription factor 3C polypeptide 3 (transcription factor C subunit 4)